jgi:hypothetical protein
MNSDVLIIDPISVPRGLVDAGLTPEVMARRVGNRIDEIEMTAKSQPKQDTYSGTDYQGKIPDIEIPGSKLGLRTVVEFIRDILDKHPSHIGGDIVLSVGLPADARSPQGRNQAKVTVYVTYRGKPNPGASALIASDDVDSFVQRAAEMALEKINPYPLAAYLEDHHENARSLEIVQRMIQSPLDNSPSKAKKEKVSALDLWGTLLYDDEKYEEAIAKIRMAMELDPQDFRLYNTWGRALGGGESRRGDCKVQEGNGA